MPYVFCFFVFRTDMISWQQWHSVIIRQGQLGGSLKRQADLISCCLCRGHAPLYEKKFHHKPSPNLSPTTSINILLRQKGVVAAHLIKTLNSVLLHLSCTLFFFSDEVSELTQALPQNIQFFYKMQIINSLSCCLANCCGVIQLFSLQITPPDSKSPFTHLVLIDESKWTEESFDCLVFSSIMFAFPPKLPLCFSSL